MAAYGFDEDLAPLRIQDFSIPTAGYQELCSVVPIHPPLHVCVPLLHPDKQIRLLELDPVYSLDPNTAPPLHGRLRIVSLEEHREYSALSYVWAQEDPGTSQRQNRLIIHCAGHQHEARIGPNCWSALWHLSKARGALAIWVDSVCINQKNNEEKAQQIPLMRVIYDSAQTTYLWLGEAEKGITKAIGFLSKSVLCVSRGTATDILKATLVFLMRRHTFQVYPHRSALHKIFKRPWIERLWTLQETVLSCNSIVVCGESSVAWEDLACALESIHFFRTRTLALFFEDSYMPWLNLAHLTRWFAKGDTRHSGRQLPLGQTSDRVRDTGGKVDRQLRCLKLAFWLHFVIYGITWFLMSINIVFQSARESRTGPGFGAPLSGLIVLWITISHISINAWATTRRVDLSLSFDLKSHSIIQELRTRKATDPKDIYFGTLGILNDNSFVAEGSVLALYKRLCASLVRRTGNLDILLYANADTEKRFPSWVIDWRLGTPHIWEKALVWIPTNQRPYQLQWILLQDLVSTQSEFWIRLANATRNNVLYQWLSACSLMRSDLDTGKYGGIDVKIMRYRGATPDLKPFWELRNQAEHLCVRGLVLTEICSCLALTSTSSTAEAQPVLRDLTAAREATHVDHIGLVEVPHAMSTSEAATRHSEVCMFTSFVHSALSITTEDERAKTADRCNKLIDVITNNRDSAARLWMWWRRLLLSTANNQGPAGWVEDLLAEDSSLKKRLGDFMGSLGEEGLSVVRCHPTELHTGSLAFSARAAQEGDFVALVSGVSYPLVLRPCGEEQFKLIGPIFLPTVMDGELMGFGMLTSDSLVDTIILV